MPAQRLPDLRLDVERVLVLEERGRLGIVPVPPRLGVPPVLAHALDHVPNERLLWQLVALGDRPEGHLDGVVHDPTGPLLA